MKNKTPIRTFFFIVAVTVFSAFVAMPREVPIRFSVGNIKVNKTLTRSGMDLSALGIPFVRDLELKKGLDIQGGTEIVLDADMSQIGETERQDALQSATEIIKRRVDLYGVSEPAVQTSLFNGRYRINVELPGVTNTEEAVQLIGTTAQLDFRLQGSQSAQLEAAISSTTSATIQDIIGFYGSFIRTGLTGEHLKRSTVQFDSQTGEPTVSLQFDSEGQKMFGEITKDNVGKPVAIFLDDAPVTMPIVNEPILNGEAVISGNFTLDDAKNLSIQLNAGALPVPITVVQQQTLGASLGQVSVEKTTRAGVIGVGMVMLFMVLYYGWKGLLADLALGVYALVTVALYKLIPVTLTLPGIAGLLLSVGMAVDSNILIFERMKEELRAGKPFRQAMELGFGRAWDSIKDANVATIITSLILINPLDLSFLNRSGTVRGFGITLLIGILVSLFTGIIVTRTFLRLFLRQQEAKRGKA